MPLFHHDEEHQARHGHGVGATAGVKVNGAEVNLDVTAAQGGEVDCTLTCNGRRAKVTFGAEGDVSADVNCG